MYDYTIKCVEGIYKDKFFFINTYKQGETIGSSTEGDVSICIEKSDLAPMHTEIKLKEAYNYYIMDKSEKQMG